MDNKPNELAKLLIFCEENLDTDDVYKATLLKTAASYFENLSYSKTQQTIYTHTIGNLLKN